jgi:hypothetical protein
MEISRLVELSIFYKLQEFMAVKRLAEKPKSADFQTYNLKYTSIQTSFPVVVYVNSVVHSESLYTVNYINGTIKFNTALLSTDLVEVDYYYCPVRVYDEGSIPKKEGDSNNISYPAIGFIEDESKYIPYEIGNSSREKHSTWIFELYSERGGERNDITDNVVEFLEGGIDVIDFNIAFPINQDGTKNINYNESAQIYGYMSADSINCIKDRSYDIGGTLKYMSHIFVDFIINK